VTSKALIASFWWVVRLRRLLRVAVLLLLLLAVIGVLLLLGRIASLLRVSADGNGGGSAPALYQREGSMTGNRMYCC
jgi:hypothetical protein